MSETALSSFYRPLRVVLGDWQPTNQAYSDAALLQSLQAVVQLGKLNDTVLSATGGYALTPDESGVTPAISNANLFALTIYHAAKLFFNPLPSGQSLRTRPVSRSWGSYARTLASWDAEIHKLENGEMFDGYQSLYSWLSGIYHLPVEVLSEVEINMPVWTVRAGIIQ